MQGTVGKDKDLDFGCQFQVQYVQYKTGVMLDPCTCDLHIVMSSSGNAWAHNCPCLSGWATWDLTNATSVEMQDVVFMMH